MVFVSAAVSAAQKPRQPYGTGLLFPSAHSVLYSPTPLRLTHLYVVIVAGQVAGVVFPRTGVGRGPGEVRPPSAYPLKPGKNKGGFHVQAYCYASILSYLGGFVCISYNTSSGYTAYLSTLGGSFLSKVCRKPSGLLCANISSRKS
jgi:hypothetical protein